MLSNLLIIASATTMAGDQNVLHAVSLDEGIGFFQRICFMPFPDPARSLLVIEEPKLELVKERETPSQAMQPGDAWMSSNLRVTYVDADWLPRDFGSPQCSVTVALEGDAAPEAVASAFAKTLGLPGYRIPKAGLRSQTQWDIPGRAPDAWRIFLTTQKTPAGTEMRATIMNLRGKKARPQ